MQIAHCYELKYGSSLKADLDETLKQRDSSYFKHAVLGMFDTRAELCARFSFLPDYPRIVRVTDVFIPFLCSCGPDELKDYKEALSSVHSFDVSKSNYCFYFWCLLSKMLTVTRSQEESTRKIIEQEASSLNCKMSVEYFTTLLTTCSFDHLRALFLEYKEVHKEDIEDSIRKMPHTELTHHFKSVVQCIKGQFRHDFQMMKESRSDYLQASLIYAILSRCEGEKLANFDGTSDFSLANYILEMFPYDNSLCHLLLTLCQVGNSDELV